MYTHLFEIHADVLRAMAHPKRLEIIHLLREQILCVAQMQQMLGLPQANLSQHLHVLRQAGVVSTQRDGRMIRYSLSHANFIQASDLLREVLIDRAVDPRLASELTLSMQELVPVAMDPVCGMRLSPKTAAYALSHGGQRYYFCAAGCMHSFQENPQEYVNAE